MRSSKEVVLFTQDKSYCIKHNCSLENFEHRKKSRLYGVMTGLAVLSQKFDKSATELEIKNYFSRTTDFQDFILIVKDIGKTKIGFVVNKDIAYSLYRENDLIYLSIADIILLNAYSKYIKKDEYTIIGYFDKENAYLVYEIVGNDGIYQFLQRKSVKIGMYNSSIPEEQLIRLAINEIENIIKLEQQRTDKKIKYVIAGVNDSYDKIFTAAINIPKKESIHKAFVNEKTLFYKKGIISLALIGAVLDALLVPKYFHLKENIMIANNKLNRIQSYINKENQLIKKLYIEKGKTIVLQDKIDISKISQILNDINILPPGKIVYKDTPNSINVDMYYIDSNILAQKYYNVLKRNKKIQVQLFINPTMTIARIHVIIPKEAVR